MFTILLGGQVMSRMMVGRMARNVATDRFNANDRPAAAQTGDHKQSSAILLLLLLPPPAAPAPSPQAHTAPGI